MTLWSAGEQVQCRSTEVEIRSIRLCLSETDRRERQAEWNGEVVGRRRDEEAGGSSEEENSGREVKTHQKTTGQRKMWCALKQSVRMKAEGGRKQRSSARGSRIREEDFRGAEGVRWLGDEGWPRFGHVQSRRGDVWGWRLWQTGRPEEEQRGDVWMWRTLSWKKALLLLLFCHFWPAVINLPLLQLLSASSCSFWILFTKATSLRPLGT